MDRETLYKFFEGAASYEEEVRIRQWMEHSPENRREFLKERKIFDSMLLLGDEKTIEEKERHKSWSLSSLGTELIKIVAVVAVTLGLSLLYQFVSDKNGVVPMQSIYVPTGQRVNITLSDGTNVWLNACSEMTYPASFSEDIRRVSLKGEAYFDVRKDEEHPFVVRTRFGEVTVLGTAFNINAYNDADACYTTLVYGKVNFSTPDQNTITLAPGEQAVASSRGIEKRVVDVNEYIGWAQGVYVFNNKRLGDIMKTFERWYDVHVYYEKESLRDLTYSGDLQRYGTINTFLNALELTGDIYYRINGRNILIYENE